MENHCDICGNAGLESVYPVPDSPLGAEVLLCPACGLLQSRYTKPKPAGRVRSLSSGPDWGNVRHGKGLRLKSNLEFIGRHGDPSGWRHVLDVGSNRGHFCLHALAAWPVERVVAIEPDPDIVAPYRDREKLVFLGRRFEHTDLGGETFDFIYCSHTLEHAASARVMLAGLRRLLRPEGRLFIEVPSVRILENTDHLEEFFIDKHTFHFHPATLAAAVRHAGFEIVAETPPADSNHVTLMLRPAPDGAAVPAFPAGLGETAAAIRRSLAHYSANLAANRRKLDTALAKIEFLVGRQKVAFWGAGRQLDAFLRHTGFDPRRVGAVIDEHLHGIIGDVRGAAVRPPDVLRTLSPQVVVAFARQAFPEIARRCRSYGVKNVIKFSDLLD